MAPKRKAEPSDAKATNGASVSRAAAFDPKAWCYKADEARPWQKRYEEDLMRPTVLGHREIQWFFDPKGSAGKSQFASYMEAYYPDDVCVLGVGGYKSMVRIASNSPYRTAYIFDNWNMGG